MSFLRGSQNENGFTGPLFIIGMPRSGTKLLRGLLNRHPMIGIPPSETEFFPWLNSHYEQFGDLSVRGRFNRFYKEMGENPLFPAHGRTGGRDI